MAFQPETATYDSGVLQLEVTTPVQGGVGGASNTPILSLANRTAYLKAHIDAIEAAAAGNAQINSPVFTGDPRAPTPAAGDSDTSLATTAFVQSTVYGVTSKNVAGNTNVVLTAAEAGAGVLAFSGALTGNIAVIVPSAAKSWVIVNSTTGAFTLTVKTAAGSGPVVTQSRTTILVCDGTNVFDPKTDFPNVNLTGTPVAPTAVTGRSDTMIATTGFVAATVAPLAPIASPVFTGDPRAPTPNPGDNDTSIATTNFVQAALAAYATNASLAAYATNAALGNYAPLASPHLSGVPTAPTASTASNDGTLATTAFVQALIAAGHQASIGNPGYQRLPGGLIIQWGQVLAGAGVAAMSFPIAFPSTILQIVVTGYVGATVPSNVGAATYSAPTLSGATLQGSIASNCTFNYIAIGA